MKLFHGTAVSYNGSGILILGPSGSGKSDLALRLINEGADLIADDQVLIKLVGKALQLSAPDSISGLIEVRGVGIIKIKPVCYIPLSLIVEIKSGAQLERIPIMKKDLIEEIPIPVIKLDAFEGSAIAKIKILLKCLDEEIELIQ